MREAVGRDDRRTSGRKRAGKATAMRRGQTREVAVPGSAETGHEALPVLVTRKGFDAATLRFIEPEHVPPGARRGIAVRGPAKPAVRHRAARSVRTKR
jgi:hypothetical protein